MKNGAVLVWLIVFLILSIIGSGAFGVWYIVHKTPKADSNTTRMKRSTPLLEYDDFGPYFKMEPLKLSFLSRYGVSKPIGVVLTLQLEYPYMVNEIEVKKQKLLQEAEKILKTKTLEDLYSLSGRVQSASEIRDRFNAMLVDGEIKKVYIDLE